MQWNISYFIINLKICYYSDGSRFLEAGDKVVILYRKDSSSCVQFNSRDRDILPNSGCLSICSNYSGNSDELENNYNSSLIEEVVSVVYFGHERIKKPFLKKYSKASIVGIMAKFSGKY